MNTRSRISEAMRTKVCLYPPCVRVKVIFSCRLYRSGRVMTNFPSPSVRLLGSSFFSGFLSVGLAIPSIRTRISACGVGVAPEDWCSPRILTAPMMVRGSGRLISTLSRARSPSVMISDSVLTFGIILFSRKRWTGSLRSSPSNSIPKFVRSSSPLGCSHHAC